MSLTERLDSLAKSVEATNSPGNGCKLVRILESDKFTEAERTKFMTLVNVPKDTRGRVTSAALAKFLRMEGFRLSDKAVERHRADSCGCYQTAGAKE